MGCSTLPQGGSRQPMPLADAHAHLDADAFRADLAEVVQRARRAGLVHILCVGTDLASSRRCCALARRWPELVRAAVGIHPNAAGPTGADAWRELGRLAERPEAVAIGEIGLDYHYETTAADVQRDRLRRQAELAARMDLPVIVHSRKADDDVLDVLAEWSGALRGVRHCFDRPAAVADAYLALGFSVSVGGAITRDGYRRFKAAASALPADRILLETDCPYQSPAGHARERNEPALLPEVLHALAAVRGDEPPELARQTTRNARALLFRRRPGGPHAQGAGHSEEPF